MRRNSRGRSALNCAIRFDTPRDHASIRAYQRRPQGKMNGKKRIVARDIRAVQHPIGGGESRAKGARWLFAKQRVRFLTGRRGAL